MERIIAGWSEVATTRNGPGHALGSQVPVDELHHLTASFTHQGDHIHIGFDIPGNHTHKRTLTHAAAGEDAHSLALAHGKQAIDGPDTQLHYLSDGRALHGVGGLSVDGVPDLLLLGERVPAVNGTAQGIHRTAQHLGGDSHFQLPSGVDHHAAGTDAVQFLIGHQLNGILQDSHHLCQGVALLAQLDTADISHIAFQAGGLYHQPHDLADLALAGVEIPQPDCPL